MEAVRNVDPVIRVRRVCGWQVDWLAGLLNIQKKEVVELATDGFIETHSEELANRTQQMFEHPTLND